MHAQHRPQLAHADLMSGGFHAQFKFVHVLVGHEALDHTTAGRCGQRLRGFRRASVATYEVELNLVIHSYGGDIELDISSSELKITARDTGPGIPDISLAMQEGYSTASEEARSMGFGAGMGLPNMQRNASEFDIQSTVGVGTTIKMRFSLE